MSEQPANPQPRQLPPWAVRLIDLGGMALALWLAARFGITLPPPVPAPTPAPSVLVLTVSPTPASGGAIPVAAGK